MKAVALAAVDVDVEMATWNRGEGRISVALTKALGFNSSMRKCCPARVESLW
jgi:hypothetical protein